MPVHHLLAHAEVSVGEPQEHDVLCGTRVGTWSPRKLTLADLPEDLHSCIESLQSQICVLQETMTELIVPMDGESHGSQA